MVAIHPTRHTVRVPMAARHIIRVRLLARVQKAVQVQHLARCIPHRLSPSSRLIPIHWVIGL